MPMVTLTNQNGRPLDGYDVMRAHAYARDVVGDRDYSIFSRDGYPICGFVSHSRREHIRITNPNFSASFPSKGEHMKILCLTTFLHEKDRFEKGDMRTVEDSLAAYFIAQGWAGLAGVDPVSPADGPVNLAVQDATMGQEANHG